MECVPEQKVPVDHGLSSMIQVQPIAWTCPHCAAELSDTRVEGLLVSWARISCKSPTSSQLSYTLMPIGE